MPVSIENVKCTHETDAALRCEIDGDEVWVPKSQVDDDSEVYKKGDEGTLVVSDWFAHKAGLED